MRTTVGREQHAVGEARLRESYAALPAGAPVRLAKRTSNLFRGRSASGAGLDVSGLTGVIEVDGDVGRAAAAPPRVLAVPKGKLEGVCFVPDGLLLTSESREVFLLKP